MVKVDVYFTPSELVLPEGRDSAVIIGVDVLRASTSICSALSAGAKEVIPVGSLEDALKIYSNLDKSNVLLCGEKNSVKIDGFHLGNSPLDYIPELVSGKTLILYTTNGSALFSKLLDYQYFFVGSFVNLSALLNKATELISNSNCERLILACAGQDNKFALEDTVFCGCFIERLEKVVGGMDNLKLNDGALASYDLFVLHKDNFSDYVKSAEHSKVLIDLGFEKDVDFALKIDALSVIPAANGSSKGLQLLTHSTYNSDSVPPSTNLVNTLP
jgi:2-phosphosulfolactate phosphatase